MRWTAATWVLLLIVGQVVADEFLDITFAGRKLQQSKRRRRRRRDRTSPPIPPPPGGGSPGIPAQEVPPPQGGTVADWEIRTAAEVKGSVVRVFNRMKDPKDALTLAFGELIFTATKDRKDTRLVLNSGRELVIRNTRSGVSRPGLFHLFRVQSVTPGVIRAGDTDIDIAGSQFFIQVTGVSTATVEMGWLSVVSPPDLKDLVTVLFEGILEELVDSLKSVFRGRDCDKVGLESLFRDVSGVCNNINRDYGSAKVPLVRLAPSNFGDGMNTPGGSKISAREISNIVCREGDRGVDDGSNQQGVTDMHVFFAQFVDHDIGISPVGSFAQRIQPLFSTSFEKFLDELPIEIPANDPDFQGTGKTELPFERAAFLRENNKEVIPREIINELTSYLDLSQVYGSTGSRARALRSFQDGKMKTSQVDFLPFNGQGVGGIGLSVENAEDPSDRFYVGGDIRANENANLLAMHIIWLREHNKLAEELKPKFPNANDEQIYQLARAINTAQYQSILYTEWLPFILGQRESPNPSAFKYSNKIDAGANIFFTTASFRYGHSMVSGQLWRVDPGKTTPSERVNLRDVFFKPEVVTPANLDSWIRGMLWHEAREPDEKVTDELRTFLFTPDGKASQDLVALNLQRARDMGIPTYNQARKSLNLPEARTFAEISDNPQTVQNLEEAYEGRIDEVDGFIGGLAETTPAGRFFGDLFHESIKEQFIRLRDGDRLFYKDLDFELIMKEYPRAQSALDDKIKMIDILERNTGITKAEMGTRTSAFQL